MVRRFPPGQLERDEFVKLVISKCVEPDEEMRDTWKYLDQDLNGTSTPQARLSSMPRHATVAKLTAVVLPQELSCGIAGSISLDELREQLRAVGVMLAPWELRDMMGAASGIARAATNKIAAAEAVAAASTAKQAAEASEDETAMAEAEKELEDAEANQRAVEVVTGDEVEEYDFKDAFAHQVTLSEFAAAYGNANWIRVQVQP